VVVQFEPLLIHSGDKPGAFNYVYLLRMVRGQRLQADKLIWSGIHPHPGTGKYDNATFPQQLNQIYDLHTRSGKPTQRIHGAFQGVISAPIRLPMPTLETLLFVSG